MMQEPKNTDGTPAVAGDASDSFISQTKKIGYGSILTDPTFPLARRGIEFYVANPGVVKDRLFGELESTADKVDTAFQSIVNRMGDGAGLGESIRKNFTAAVSQVQLIGLDFKDVQETAEAALDVFKTNVTLSEDQYTNLLATQEVTGVVAKDLLTGFRDSGMAIKDITKEMYNVTQIATSIGVNAKIVSAAVVSNLDKLNRYGFQNGVEGLAKMAAKASALRIDLSETLDIADDLMDPEGAIELASTLQRLGTTSAALTDPLRLMDMAQNDVGALQEELANMFSTYAEFNEENQRFEILPSARRELKQLEKELGLPLGTIEKMAIGTKELDKKLSEISFSGFDVPKETQELIANMAMMNEEGEYMIKYVDPETKESMEETTTEFLERFNGDAKAMQDALGRQQKEENLTLEDINKKMLEKAGDQLTSMQQIEAYTRASTSAFGLGAGGGEYGKQILIANEQLAKDFNTGLIQNLGPNSDIVRDFNSLAETQRKLVETLQSDTATKEEKKKAVGEVMAGYGKVGETVVKSVGTAAGQIATDVGGTLGIDVPGLQDALNLLGVSSDDINKFRTSLDNGATSVTNFVGSLFGKTPTSTPAAAAGTTTTTGPTSSITPVQTVGSVPTTVQQVNQITSLPEQNTAENLLAPKVQEATEKGMSEALSYYSASPSLAVTIKKDETEGKRIQVPKKPEEIPTESNLVPTPASVTLEATVTKPETPKSEETKIEVKRASKEEVGLFGQTPAMTGPLKIKEEEEIEKRTEFVTKLTDVEIKNYEEKKNQQSTFTNFLNKENDIRRQTLEDIQKQKTISLDSQNKEFIFGQQLNEQIIERDNYVTQFTEEEIRLIEEQNSKQLSFNELFEKEIENRRISTENNLNQQSIIANTKKEEISVGRQLNEQMIERTEFVSMLSEQEISKLDQQNERQLSFNNLLNQENSIREEYVTKLQETEKDKSLTSVVSGGELTNVSETLSTVNEENVKNKTKTVTETATELHKKLATLYDGIIDESEKSVVTAIGQGEKIQESTVFKPDIPKPTTGERTVVTETDFGFGQEIPTSVAEFKGAEDIINQFFTPEAIAAVATPPVENLDKKSAEYKEFMSTQNNNQTTTIGGEAKVKVEVTGIKDPTAERELIKSVKDSIINSMTFNYGTQQTVSNAANMGSSNFGLTSPEIPGF